jgi:replicative DNA helicase
VTAAGPRGSADLPLPANLAAERVVLGALIEDDGLLPEVLETGLQPEDFLLSDHHRIFRVVLALGQENAPVDYITVAEQLGNRPEDYVAVASLVDGLVIDRDHVIHHAKTVRRKARLRALLRIGEWISAAVTEASDPDQVVEEISRKADECRT